MNALALPFVPAFVVSVDLRIIAPVLPSIATSLHATAGAIGLAMTTYAVAYGSGQLVHGCGVGLVGVGIVTARIRRRRSA